MDIFVELLLYWIQLVWYELWRSRIIRSKDMNIWYILLELITKMMVWIYTPGSVVQVEMWSSLSVSRILKHRKFHLNKKTWSLHLQDQMLKTALSLPLLAPALVLSRSRLLLNLIQSAQECCRVLSSHLLETEVQLSIPWGDLLPEPFRWGWPWDKSIPLVS